MKSKIIEIVELGHPKSLIHRLGEPIDEIIDTEMMLQELNRQLAAPAVSKCEGIEREGTVCRCCGKKLINPEAIFGFCDSECMETFRQTDC